MQSERVLICGDKGGLRCGDTHATVAERFRAADGAALNHIVSPTSLCGALVKRSHPFQPAGIVLLLDETRSCHDCLEMILNRRIAAACHR